MPAKTPANLRAFLDQLTTATRAALDTAADHLTIALSLGATRPASMVDHVGKALAYLTFALSGFDDQPAPCPACDGTGWETGGTFDELVRCRRCAPGATA